MITAGYSEPWLLWRGGAGLRLPIANRIRRSAPLPGYPHGQRYDAKTRRWRERALRAHTSPELQLTKSAPAAKIVRN
jgi:hypothetical protein